MKHYNIHVTGKVQGVFFRASAREKAREIGVTGFVRNEPDGSVYIEAEGSPEQLEKLIQWCQQGPPQAIIEKVVSQQGIPIGFMRFEILR